MIRTKIVELSAIAAVAYRQKLKDGKSGVVVMRYDQAQPGLASFSRKTGDPVPNANVNLDLFPLRGVQRGAGVDLGHALLEAGSRHPER